MEVDVLVQTGDRLVGMEIRNRGEVARADARALRAVAGALGARWRGGMVVYTGLELRQIDGALDLWAVPVHRLL